MFRVVWENIRQIIFSIGFILFFDELWMFGIPLGRILPDLTAFHIGGIHHWMIGLSLMLVVMIHWGVLRVTQKIKKDSHIQIMTTPKRVTMGGSYLILFFLLLISFSWISTIPEIATDSDSNRIPSGIYIDAGIYIDGNPDFITQARAENWPGDGTATNPFVISNQQINGSDSLGNEILIDIRNTNVHFYFHNLLLRNAGHGMSLTNVRNAVIEDVTITECVNGISIHQSENIRLINSTISRNSPYRLRSIPILVWESAKINLTKNTITDNKYGGIEIRLSSHNVVSSNFLSSNSGSPIVIEVSGKNIISNNVILANESIFVYGNYLQSSVTNNTINGKPIIYWQNVTEGVVPENAGQIFLINSTGVKVTNQTIAHMHSGIEAISCTNLLIHNNSFTNNERGVFLWETNNSSISNNTLHNNFDGMAITGSNFNNITYNVVINNGGWTGGDGISLTNSHKNTLIGNLISNDPHGSNRLTLSESNNNVLVNNTIQFSASYGIYLFDSINTTVKWNNLVGNNFPEGNSQAIDSGENNTFEYNYWSDWISPDNNTDGIVDNPYPIDGEDSKDPDIVIINNSNNDPFPLVSKTTTSGGGGIPS